MDIIIQTHIRNIDSHPGTDSEKIDLDFLNFFLLFTLFRVGFINRSLPNGS